MVSEGTGGEGCRGGGEGAEGRVPEAAGGTLAFIPRLVGALGGFCAEE